MACRETSIEYPEAFDSDADGDTNTKTLSKITDIAHCKVPKNTKDK